MCVSIGFYSDEHMAPLTADVSADAVVEPVLELLKGACPVRVALVQGFDSSYLLLCVCVVAHGLVGVSCLEDQHHPSSMLGGVVC